VTDPLAEFRCRHGHLLLGCPDGACPEQSAYLVAQTRALAEWECHQQEAAQGVVRAARRLAHRRPIPAAGNPPLNPDPRRQP
jgi:hypothetical protein